MANYTKKAAKGAVLAFSMMLIHSILAFLLKITLARNLTPTEYGLFYAVFTLVLFFLLLRDAALNQAVIKFVAEYQAKKDYTQVKTILLTGYLFQFIFSVGLSLGLYFLIPFLSNYYFKTPLSVGILKAMIVYIFASLLLSINNSLLTGFQEIKWYTTAKPLRILSILLAVFLFLQLDYGYISAALGFVAGTLIAAVILSAKSLKYSFLLKYKINDFFATGKQLFGFGIPIMLMGLGSTTVGYFDTLMLTYLASLRDVGVYNIILSTATMLIFFGTAISFVLFPMISELKGLNDGKRIAKGVSMIYRFYFALIIPILFTIFVFAEEAIKLFFGEEYASGAFAFRILLLGILGYSLATVNNHALGGLGKPRIVAKIIILSAIVNVLANLVLIPPLGITGAAIATSVSYFIVFILSTSALSRLAKVSTPWLPWIKNIFLGVIIAGIMQLIRVFLALHVVIEASIGILISGLIYVLLVIKLDIVRVKDVKYILRRVLLN